MAHTGGPGDIPSVCIVPTFCQVVRLVHMMAYIWFTFLCLHTSQLASASSLWCLSFVSFCSQMEEHQNVRPSTGTTEWNHSYYTGNSLSALHSLQQLHDDTVSTSVQPLVSTQETNGTASSGFCVRPTVTTQSQSAHMFRAGPTRNCHRRSNANFAR